ncbi:MAG: hypothetical protein A3I66_20470 [Burkholderiales bacterium RIFCSPLOWO2_02_FULL_57_36]|jgi:hypothetical protein|nr:MAG: hypothetical protein A3I66_20470 [Burkholderiales bacterium RIFCSPLOWO2_02_FULL_57_36]
MHTLSNFLSGDLVYTAVTRWLDKKVDKSFGFRRAQKVGAGLSFIRIGRYYEEQGYCEPWRLALKETLWHQRHSTLHDVNRFSYPTQSFRHAWLSQGKS